MLVVRTSESCTDSLSQLAGAEQTVGLDHLALAVNPFGLDRVEPWALLGQQTTDDPHPFLLALFESPVAATDPAPDLPACVPTGIVPDQHQHLYAELFELLTAPPQKVRGYGAHRTTVHKPKPTTLFKFGHIQPVAGNGLRVGIVFFKGLLYKTQRFALLVRPLGSPSWFALLAKAVQVRLGYSAP